MSFASVFFSLNHFSKLIRASATACPFARAGTLLPLVQSAAQRSYQATPSHSLRAVIVNALHHQEQKKPTWWNTQGYSTTSAYSSTSLPAQPGCSLSSHPTTSLESREQVYRHSPSTIIVCRLGAKAIGQLPFFHIRPPIVVGPQASKQSPVRHLVRPYREPIEGIFSERGRHGHVATLVPVFTGPIRGTSCRASKASEAPGTPGLFFISSSDNFVEKPRDQVATSLPAPSHYAVSGKRQGTVFRSSPTPGIGIRRTEPRPPAYRAFMPPPKRPLLARVIH